MKMTWEPKDLLEGRIVVKNRDILNNPINGWISKHTYKLGYTFKSQDSKRWIAMAIACDGMIVGPFSNQEMVDFMNNSDYRPATMEEFIEIVKANQKQLFP